MGVLTPYEVHVPVTVADLASLAKPRPGKALQELADRLVQAQAKLYRGLVRQSPGALGAWEVTVQVARQPGFYLVTLRAEPRSSEPARESKPGRSCPWRLERLELRAEHSAWKLRYRCARCDAYVDSWVSEQEVQRDALGLGLLGMAKANLPANCLCKLPR